MHSSMRRRLTYGVCVLALSFTGIPCINAVQAEPTAALNTAAPQAINSTQDVVQWMTYYYLHPQPDLLVPALQYADSTGLIDKGQAPLTAFVSRVFAQNPQRIAEWVTQLQGLSNRSKPLLWTALWWSSTLEGKQSLDGLIKTLNEKQADAVLSQMAHPAVPLENIEIKTPEALDELWGAFSATGDVKYVNRLISVVPWAYDAGGDFNRMSIGSAARWSLTSNAQQHPLVLKACVKARDTQPELRSALDKIISSASKPAAVHTGQNGPSL